jgi:hypothetical protein
MNQTCEIKAVCEEIDQLLQKIKHEKQLVDNRLTVHIQELYCQLENKRGVLARLKLERLERVAHGGNPQDRARPLLENELGEKWKQKQSIG